MLGPAELTGRVNIGDIVADVFSNAQQKEEIVRRLRKRYLSPFLESLWLQVTVSDMHDTFVM